MQWLWYSYYRGSLAAASLISVNEHLFPCPSSAMGQLKLVPVILLLKICVDPCKQIKSWVGYGMQQITDPTKSQAQPVMLAPCCHSIPPSLCVIQSPLPHLHSASLFDLHASICNSTMSRCWLQCFCKKSNNQNMCSFAAVGLGRKFLMCTLDQKFLLQKPELPHLRNNFSASYCNWLKCTMSFESEIADVFNCTYHVP